MENYDEIAARVRKKLDPKSIKQTLTLAALCITTYEVLEDTIFFAVDMVNLYDFDRS